MRQIVRAHYEPYSIKELIASLQTDDCKLTYLVKDGEQTTTEVFATHDQVLDVLKRFNNRSVLIEADEELTNAQKRSQFRDMLGNFWSRRGQEFGRLAEGFKLDYDPISNYDRYETGGWTDSTTDTFGETEVTETETPRVSTTTTTTPGVVMKTTENVSGDNSDELLPNSETISEPVGEHSDTVTVTPTEGTNETVTAGIEHEDTHETERSYNDYHIFGNIGITTPAQMLTAEKDMRAKLDLITEAVTEFVQLVSIYYV